MQKSPQEMLQAFDPRRWCQNQKGIPCVPVSLPYSRKLQAGQCVAVQVPEGGEIVINSTEHLALANINVDPLWMQRSGPYGMSWSWRAKLTGETVSVMASATAAVSIAIAEDPQVVAINFPVTSLSRFSAHAEIITEPTGRSNHCCARLPRETCRICPSIWLPRRFL